MQNLILLVVLSPFVATAVTQYENESSYHKNCKQILEEGVTTSGYFVIKPDFFPEPFLVYCDMEIEGGGWTYILQRVDASENFTRLWDDYKNGFGNTASNFWLGLEYIHRLTVNELNELLIVLTDWDMNTYLCHYDFFTVGGEDTDYRLLLIGGFSGDFNDRLTSTHGGRKFSTIDRDNDDNDSWNCSEHSGQGGWWYRNCFQSQLTGKYLQRDEAVSGNSMEGIIWQSAKNVSFYSFREARMMIRPKS